MTGNRARAAALATAGLAVAAGLALAPAASAAEATGHASGAAVREDARVTGPPPGYVYTGKKSWTHSGCMSDAADLIAGGGWRGPAYCDGGGVFWDLFLIPA